MGPGTYGEQIPSGTAGAVFETSSVGLISQERRNIQVVNALAR